MSDRKCKSKNQVMRENNDFSLEEFFRIGKKNFGAVIVITPNQAIYNYSDSAHKNDVEDIYRVIYPDFDKFLLRKEENYSWTVRAISYGNIVIRCCYEYNSIIYVSDKINEFQYQELLKLKEQFDDISKSVICDGLEFSLNEIPALSSFGGIVELLANNNRVYDDYYVDSNEILLVGKGRRR